MQPLVSVIIPCFNVEAFIKECLDNVLNQTYNNIEILCIDNNSSDNTFTILKEYETKFGQKVKVLQEFKSGASAARNTGLKECKGELVQFLDADDLLDPEKLKHQVLLIDVSNADIVVGAYRKKLRDGSVRDYLPQKEGWSGLLLSQLGITSSNLFRREPLLSINGWKESLKSSQEYDLMFRMLKKKYSYVVDYEMHTLVRERSANISNSNIMDNNLRFIYLRKEIKEFLKNNNLLTKELEVIYYKSIFNSIRKIFLFDKGLSEKLFLEEIEGKFPVSSIVSSKYYLFYKILGFSKTEKLLTVI